MTAYFEGRLSDSPYIHMVWRGRVIGDYYPVCPADVRWNLLLLKREGRVKVTVEGPTDQFIAKSQTEGSEFLVIKFKLGAFMPHLPVTNLLNADALLPDASSRSFWLKGSAWQFPDFENAETFVDRLVREGLLVVDPVVDAALKEYPVASPRTLRRRFLHVTGLPQGTIRQIERAQFASSLLEHGTPILDVVEQAGYADQPHLTRAMRRFIGTTPARIAQTPPLVESPAAM
jgi:hypothetical protein